MVASHLNHQINTCIAEVPSNPLLNLIRKQWLLSFLPVNSNKKCKEENERQEVL